MEGSDPGLDSDDQFDHSEGYTYPALVLLLTIPFSAAISNAFPLINVISFATGANFDFGYFPYPVLLQLAAVLLAVLVFYEVGKRIDFAESYKLLAVLTFVGALIGNLPGFYVYNGLFLGVIRGYGLGYVSSFGIPEPIPIINLLIAAVAAFMVPLCGLALAHFRFQFTSSLDETGPGAESTGRPARLFFAVSALAVTSALAITPLVSRLLPVEVPFVLVSPTRLAEELIPGYIGVLFYPVALLVAFFFIGRRLDLDTWGLRRFEVFALSTFLGGMLGLLVGVILNTWIADFSVSALLSLSYLGMHSLSFVLAGATVAALSFAAASLGFVVKQNESLRQASAPGGSAAQSPSDF